MNKKEVIEIIRELSKNNDCRYVKPDDDVMDMLVQLVWLVEKKVKNEQQDA